MPNFFHNYPYTDFHELNLDWVISTVKSLMAEWESMKKEFSTLNEAFEDLKAYVEDYFNNLDVSEEINDKLDSMVQDGSLAALLKDIYGSELGVEIVDAVADMTDPTKTYILASDPNGYLWFWNGDSFEQSSINYFNPINALSFASSTGITDCNSIYRQAVRFTSGEIVTISNAPPTTSGVIVIDYSTDNNSSVQIAYDFANTHDPIFYLRKKSSGTWSSWFIYNAEDYLTFIDAMTAGDLDDLDREVTKVTTDHTLDVDNMPETSTGLMIMDFSTDANAKVQIATAYASNLVPMIWIRKNNSGTWSQWYELTGNKWEQISSGDLNDYTYPCTVFWTTDIGRVLSNNPLRMGAGYCKTVYGYQRGICIQTVGSWANNFIGIKFIRTKQGTNNNWSQWNLIQPDFVHNSYGFTVIGDSLSAGVTTKTVNGVNSLSSFNMESWPKILANRIGCKVYSCSHSGYSTVDWLNTANLSGITKFNKIPRTPLYCLYLGTNDANQAVGETVFKNNYKAIIDAIKAKNANAVILCFALWRTGATWAEYNDYIEDLMTTDYASDDRVIYFDIRSEVNSAPITNHLFNGHYSVIGYKLIADAIEAKFMDIANANPALFRYEFSQIAEGTNYQDCGYPYVL